MCDRIDWKTVLVSLVVCASAGFACSGSDGDSDGKLEPVDVELQVPADDPGILALSGAVNEEVTAQSADVLALKDSDEIRLNFSGVSESCDNVTFRVNFPITEGDTGTFESVKTPQFTCKSTQYVADTPVRMTLESFTSERFMGELVATFDQKAAGDGKTPVDPPLKVEGAFAFPYE